MAGDTRWGDSARSSLPTNAAASDHVTESSVNRSQHSMLPPEWRLPFLFCLTDRATIRCQASRPTGGPRERSGVGGTLQDTRRDACWSNHRTWISYRRVWCYFSQILSGIGWKPCPYPHLQDDFEFTGDEDVGV